MSSRAMFFYGEIYGENNDDNVIITMMVDMFENKGDEHMLPSPFWDRGLAQLAIYMQHHNDDDDGGGDDGDWQVFIRNFGFTKEMQSP